MTLSLIGRLSAILSISQRLRLNGTLRPVMKLSLKTGLYQPSVSFSSLLREKLAALCKLLRIEEARIIVEKRAECSPPFRLSAHLVVPGPDIVVESADHTLRAALHKLDDLLHLRIQKMRLKQIQKISGRCQKTSPRMCP